MANKIFFISDALFASFDEGKKNIALSLHREIETRGDNLSITITNAGNETGDLKVTKISLNKLFLNNKLRMLLKKYSPDIIIYVPYSSCTFNAFLRTKILKLLYKKAKVVILGAQKRKYSSIQKSIIANFLKPDLLLLLGSSDADFFLEKGIKVKILPPAVDNAKFCPATEEEKQKIRAGYDIPDDKTIVLHVGHIRTTRNIQCLLKIQKINNIQVVIVASTSTETESKLKSRLVRGGVRIIDEFVPDISKIYKMSDIYIFPVFNKTAAIDMPLSVLEAMACNLPVLTTRFGGLVDFFKEDIGFRYFDTTKELVEVIKVWDNAEIHNNKKVEPFTWNRFTDEVIAACKELVLCRNTDLKEQFDYREKHKNSNQALNYEYNVYADDSYYSYIWEIEKNFLKKEIQAIRNTKIRYLDFACGTGRVLSFVEQYVTEPTGIDVSENMLNIAKSKVRKSLLLNCDLATDDIIGNKQYDLITAFRFFLNAQEDLRKEVMLILAEKLSNDGLFIFNIHGNTLSYYILPVILGRIGIKQVKLNHLSYFKTHKLIRNSNLKLKKMYGIGFIPSSFYRWFKPWRRFFMNTDKAFSNCRFLKFFASDLIFICTRG